MARVHTFCHAAKVFSGATAAIKASLRTSIRQCHGLSRRPARCNFKSASNPLVNLSISVHATLPHLIMGGTACIKREPSLLSHWTYKPHGKSQRKGYLGAKVFWLHFGIAIGPVLSHVGGNALSTSHRILLCY